MFVKKDFSNYPSTLKKTPAIQSKLKQPEGVNLSQLLLHKNGLRKNSEGMSGIVATIFLVIIVLFLYSQVFIFMQNENARFEEGAKEVNQIEEDSDKEKLTFSNINYIIEGDMVHVETKVTNEGPVSAEIVTLWILDSMTQRYGHNNTLNLNLKVGETLDLTGEKALSVSIQNLSSQSQLTSWLITARGNRISLENKINNVLVANVASGIGSIGLNFDEFKHYNYETTSKLANFPLGNTGFDIPKGQYVAFGCYLTNYDPKERLITLDSHSLLFQPGRTGVGEGSWYIVNVASNGSISSLDEGTFTDITLNYGEEKLIVFASKFDLRIGNFDRLRTANAVATVSTSLLLHGTIGPNPFAQSIPFVALFYY